MDDDAAERLRRAFEQIPIPKGIDLGQVIGLVAVGTYVMFNNWDKLSAVFAQLPSQPLSADAPDVPPASNTPHE